ncbi:DUF6817 domain-containing protein [Spirillospora sp. CA-108201]
MTAEQDDRVDRETDAAELLRAKRAGVIQHPGGTLLEHLHRVHALLDVWGARPPDGVFADRFTGTPSHISSGQRQDFAELTVANELDVVHTAALNGSQVAGLLNLFVTWRLLLSTPASHAVEDARRSMLPTDGHSLPENR